METGAGKMDLRVGIALVLMQERYGQKLTLQKISQEVHLTREYFCRLFKAETGIPPARYLKALRLQKGKELLENTLMSVKEITRIRWESMTKAIFVETSSLLMASPQCSTGPGIFLPRRVVAPRTLSNPTSTLH